VRNVATDCSQIFIQSTQLLKLIEPYQD